MASHFKAAQKQTQPIKFVLGLNCLFKHKLFKPSWRFRKFKMTDPSNYHGNQLFVQLFVFIAKSYKISFSLIAEQESEKQSGFRADHSTIDNLSKCL